MLEWNKSADGAYEASGPLGVYLAEPTGGRFRLLFAANESGGEPERLANRVSLTACKKAAEAQEKYLADLAAEAVAHALSAAGSASAQAALDSAARHLCGVEHDAEGQPILPPEAFGPLEPSPGETPEEIAYREACEAQERVAFTPAGTTPPAEEPDETPPPDYRGWGRDNLLRELADTRKFMPHYGPGKVFARLCREEAGLLAEMKAQGIGDPGRPVPEPPFATCPKCCRATPVGERCECPEPAEANEPPPPEAYLSFSTGGCGLAWRAIRKGQPLCADTDRAGACEAVLIAGLSPESLPVWNGDAGAFLPAGSLQFPPPGAPLYYTTAPEEYDGHGTSTFDPDMGTFIGQRVREVVIPADSFAWQSLRYGSGSYPIWSGAEFAKVRQSPHYAPPAAVSAGPPLAQDGAPGDPAPEPENPPAEAPESPGAPKPEAESALEGGSPVEFDPAVPEIIVTRHEPGSGALNSEGDFSPPQPQATSPVAAGAPPQSARPKADATIGEPCEIRAVPPGTHFECSGPRGGREKGYLARFVNGRAKCFVSGDTEPVFWPLNTKVTPTRIPPVEFTPPPEAPRPPTEPARRAGRPAGSASKAPRAPVQAPAEALPIRGNETPISVTHTDNGSGGMRYWLAGSVPITKALRFLGARGWRWQEAKAACRKMGMDLSHNTIKSQVHSGSQAAHGRGKAHHGGVPEIPEALAAQLLALRPKAGDPVPRGNGGPAPRPRGGNPWANYASLNGAAAN